MGAGVEAGYSPLEALLRSRLAERQSSTLIADGVQVGAARILAAARSVAGRLMADGIEPGDFVLLLMKNSAEYLAAALGVTFAGAVLVPLNARYTPAEIAHLIDVARPRAWIADSDLANVLTDAEGDHSVEWRYSIGDAAGNPLRELLEWSRPPESAPVRPIEPTSPAAVFFTAGTTGRPKGALTSHAALAAFVDVVASATGMSAADTVILPMPMFYTGGLKASLANLLAGARVVVFRKWSPPDLVDAMEAYHGTFLWGVTSVWALVTRSNNFAEEKVSGLRAVWRAGSYTPRALLEDMTRIWPGRPHLHSYGLTECNLATMESDALHHPDSCGFPNVGVELTIEGERQPGRNGEIWLRGRQQFSGYLNDPDTTQRVLGGGWVRTGDTGWLDEDRRLHVLGRGSDIIIRGGENVSAAEVERVIMELPGVQEAAVVGIPDDVFGQELKAIVVAAPESQLDPDVVRAECRKVLAEFKVPKLVELRREPLPKNASGKIVKAEI